MNIRVKRQTCLCLRVWFIIAGILTVVPSRSWAQQAGIARPAVSSSIVISQVYGGGGNTNAVYKNDFVELFNRGNTTVDLSGWTLQYAASTSAFSASLGLSGTIAPGRYYLRGLGSKNQKKGHNLLLCSPLIVIISAAKYRRSNSAICCACLPSI